ncbi:MAG: hypothetical protein QOE77_4285, partial [Blastocatellia bacterium]|nr:hypothetical protein [Blastocatellia bacterium]
SADEEVAAAGYAAPAAALAPEAVTAVPEEDAEEAIGSVEAQAGPAAVDDAAAEGTESSASDDDGDDSIESIVQDLKRRGQ